MPELTADQLNNIGNNFLSIAHVLGRFTDRPNNLSPEDEEAINDLQEKIVDEADNIFTMALNVALENAAEAVKELNDITVKINADITRLANVQKVINIAGTVAILATTIVKTAADPTAATGIPNGIKDVVTAVKALTDPAV